MEQLVRHIELVIWVWNGVGQERIELVELQVREDLAQRRVVLQRRLWLSQRDDLLLHQLVLLDQDVDILELTVEVCNLGVFVGDLRRLLLVVRIRSNNFLLELSFLLLVWNFDFDVIVPM
jgi:hypothetical protein